MLLGYKSCCTRCTVFIKIDVHGPWGCEIFAHTTVQPPFWCLQGYNIIGSHSLYYATSMATTVVSWGCYIPGKSLPFLYDITGYYSLLLSSTSVPSLEAALWCINSESCVFKPSSVLNWTWLVLFISTVLYACRSSGIVRLVLVVLYCLLFSLWMHALALRCIQSFFQFCFKFQVCR